MVLSVTWSKPAKMSVQVRCRKNSRVWVVARYYCYNADTLFDSFFLNVIFNYSFVNYIEKKISYIDEFYRILN
jgi:hypothetical protein